MTDINQNKDYKKAKKLMSDLLILSYILEFNF